VSNPGLKINPIATRFLKIGRLMSMHFTFKKSVLNCLTTTALLLFGATTSFADWRKDLGAFRIGMIESEAMKLSPGELERVRSGYADALSLPVEIIRARDFPALIDAHASARIEYAIFSAAAYSTAYLVCECIEPLVQPIAADKTNGTRTVLLIDDAVTVAQIAKSKGIAVPGRNSLNGFGVPMASESVISGKLNGNEKWLIFARDTNSAAQLYAKSEVDGFFATVNSGETLATALQDGKPLALAVAASGRKTRAVWISNPVASGPHAVRKNLANEAKTILSNYLVNLAGSDPDLNDILLPADDVSFAKVNHSDYATAIAATKMLATQSGQPAQ
jgi:phosphonate transport system substrate-binding protein